MPLAAPRRAGVASASEAGVALLTGYHDGYQSRVASGTRNWLLDTRDGSRVEISGGPFGCGGLSPDGKLVVLACSDGSLQLFDRERNEVVRSVQGHDRQINRVRFSRDGSVFATAKAASSFPDSMDDRRVCVWRRDGELLQQLDFDRSGVSWFDVSADGAWVVVKTNDRALRRYPVEPMKMVEQLALREITAAERQQFGLK